MTQKLLYYLPKGYKNMDLKGYIYPIIYSSIINSSQIMDKAQMSIDWWMDKEGVVYTYKGIFLNYKKEWNIAICNDMDGAREYYAKGNKLVSERQIIAYDFTHVEFKKKHKSTWGKRSEGNHKIVS